MNNVFQKMGADLQVTSARPERAFTSLTGGRLVTTQPRVQPLSGLSVNVRHGTFVVQKNATTELQVVSQDPKGRHLLLMAKAGKVNQKFLCGHDERDWFVASVPTKATTVQQAKDSLRPGPVTEALLKAGVPSHKRHKRSNAAFIRQGEWFFVPAPNLAVPSNLILQNEPLVRPGGGKPHTVQELYRQGGINVHVHRKHAPGGLTNKEFKAHPYRSDYGWELRRRNPEAYARGTVKHADHATICLTGWHRIHINGEIRSASLGFLD